MRSLGTQSGVEAKRAVVCATGTGVGKTHVAVALLTAMRRKGLSVAGLKPVESGASSGILDADRVAASGTFHVKRPPYVFERPVSPHLAAREQGITIDLSVIVGWIGQHAADWQIVETAGGLLTPLAPGVTNHDLLRALRPAAVILVAPDRLGVLHEVTAAQWVLRSSGWPRGADLVVLSTPEVTDESTGTNGTELELLGIANGTFQLPRRSLDHPDTVGIAERLLEALIVWAR